MADRINEFSLREMGKHFADLTDSERMELKRHPLWMFVAYGVDETTLREQMIQEYPGLHFLDHGEKDAHAEDVAGPDDQPDQPA